MAEDTILGGIAQKVGTTEPALRLLISILIGKMWTYYSHSIRYLACDLRQILPKIFNILQ